MCGRFTLTDSDPRLLRMRFDLDGSIPLTESARWNIAPTDPVSAVRRAESGAANEPGRLRWGLVPGGWALRDGRRPLINARAESIAAQPAFAESFRDRRCLVIADGFYEWRHDPDRKQPVWIHPRSPGPFAFAAIWASHRTEALGPEPLQSCAIITCEPNREVATVHSRMPVILDGRAAEAAWLDPSADPDRLEALLVAAPDDSLEIRPVCDLVNDPRADGPALLDPPLHLG